MCGVIGIISKNNRDDLGALIAFGLYQLQHRGDFSAGAATIKKLPISRKDYRIGRLIATEHIVEDFEPLEFRKGRGKVTEVFDKENLERLVGFMGVGQVRYPTAGYTITDTDNNLSLDQKLKMKNASVQPMIAPYSRIAMVHNGDIHNYHEIMEHFSKKNIGKSGHNDVEAILKVFNEEFFNLSEYLRDSERVARTISQVFSRVKGTYSSVALINNVGLVAFRDPEGRRPLMFGVKRDDKGNITDYAFASETVALQKMLFKGTREDTYANGMHIFEEINPGEMIFVSKDFEFHKKIITPSNFKPCPFEGSYFARASSFINNIRVKHIRREIIENMWDRFKGSDAYTRIMEQKDNTVIVAVPRTAESAAKYLSNITHIPLEDAIEKNPYAPRIFQQPTQDHREKQTIADHFVFEEDVRGKNIILIDDSIVRGTTSAELVKYFKDVGAKEIHMFITFPEVRHPCMHAVDFHTSEELIAYNKDINQIKSAIGLSDNESLIYATKDDIRSANKYEGINMCDECYRE
ncbi:MAG: amidophosphoribosyltransferase [Candidatus Woesearchaeota archaeon]